MPWPCSNLTNFSRVRIPLPYGRGSEPFSTLLHFDFSRESIHDGFVKCTVMAVLLLAAAMSGQEVTGSIDGRVRDASGAPIAGAGGTATQTETGPGRQF